MKLVSRIFKNSKYALTSPFGYRKSINTKAGITANFHNGSDYGTYGVKVSQYAVEDGIILSCGTASDGGKFVWVEYPRLGIKCLHYHLDSINVVKGQSVNNDTILGYTGMTGKATGIHLHLGLQYLGDSTWIDPEKYEYDENSIKISLPARRYFKKGDRGDAINKIDQWLYEKYGDKLILGEVFGINTEKYVKKFQTEAKANGTYTGRGANIDGFIGPMTLNAMRLSGFPY